MNLIKLLKKLIKSNSNLSFLDIGDIIWAKRYQTE